MKKLFVGAILASVVLLGSGCHHRIHGAHGHGHHGHAVHHRRH